jgi:hypothetical protein
MAGSEGIGKLILSVFLIAGKTCQVLPIAEAGEGELIFPLIIYTKRNIMLKPGFLNREILPNENPVSLYQINDYTD